MKKLLAIPAVLLLLLWCPLAFAGPPALEQMFVILIWLVFVGLIFWLVWWALGALGLPEPFNKIAHVVVIVFAFLILLYFLLGMLPPMPTGR